MLYIIIYHKDYEEYLLGNKLGDIVKPMYLLPIETILYIISNIYDIKKIINYMMNNTSKHNLSQHFFCIHIG